MANITKLNYGEYVKLLEDNGHLTSARTLENYFLDGSPFINLWEQKGRLVDALNEVMMYLDGRKELGEPIDIDEIDV